MHDKTINCPTWQGQEGQGRCQISLTLQNTGSGINGLLIGGEKPHIGGVVLALPRLSLKGQGWSSDLFITPVPGHKDVDVARIVADSLARELNCPVVVTAGIHSDKLSQEELRLIIRHCESLAESGLAALKQVNI
ncbi:hypothetical protein Desor_3287 [Desulfosporosinus orientis DSM 765]|uniref:Prenylated flavin chaperone LpdD-like domain-containing protein n=1 Tax=Desulfosporosinus orientis (strain ATCC 19365 / DSM 765 / NCIMB 8382 / VKM B-1628 / Singapore I) TaxID=768706 RepID=G7WBN1_DESOD|nr:hypothetical protein [Desulfosporosinus orientis]AET68789.1 hypothetical protein Desor_3287 [Desulfosporosinus orientis DSM 765]